MIYSIVYAYYSIVTHIIPYLSSDHSVKSKIWFPALLCVQKGAPRSSLAWRNRIITYTYTIYIYTLYLYYILYNILYIYIIIILYIYNILYHSKKISTVSPIQTVWDCQDHFIAGSQITTCHPNVRRGLTSHQHDRSVRRDSRLDARRYNTTYRPCITTC